MPPDKRSALQRITDQGGTITAGQIAYARIALIKESDPHTALKAEEAFKAGAAYLFRILMAILDDGAEPTDADMLRMEAIDKEVQAIDHDLWNRYLRPKGSA